MSALTAPGTRVARRGAFFAAALLLLLLAAACQAQAEPVADPTPPPASEAEEEEPEAPFYDYAPWPDEPTPTPWPGGVIPVTRLSAPSEGAPEIYIETEPLFVHFQYSEPDIAVTVGDTVTLSFHARKEYHTFTVDGLLIDEVITPGQPNRFTYTFHEPGEFEFYCIPHPYMTGTLTVAAAE